MGTSQGQLDIRLKPKEGTLPEVENLNRDGYPTGGALLHVGEWDEVNQTIADGTEYQVQINFTYSKESGTYKYSGYSNLSNWALLIQL